MTDCPTHPAWLRLRGALEAPAIDAARLVARADAVCALVERGDCGLGLLPLEAIDDVLAAYVRAADTTKLQQLAVVLVARDLPYTPVFSALVDALAALPDRAARLLAVRLWMDLADQPHAAEALALIRELCADDPDGSAHVLFGYMAHRGYAVPKSEAENARLQRIAVDRGNADAMMELSALAYDGALGPADMETTIRWCREAAERGHPRACYSLGAFHAIGNGVPKDPARALAWYLRASNAGHGKASATAAVMTWRGEGTSPDPARAQQLLALAESQGFDPTPLLEEAGLS
jgi:hypothetical protein